MKKRERIEWSEIKTKERSDMLFKIENIADGSQFFNVKCW